MGGLPNPLDADHRGSTWGVGIRIKNRAVHILRECFLLCLYILLDIFYSLPYLTELGETIYRYLFY